MVAFQRGLGHHYGCGASTGRSEWREPMAKGYLIANIKVTDAERYQEYRRQTPPVIEQYGGRFLVRAGKVRDFENAFGFERLVVIEFPSVEEAQRFYSSPEYKPLLKLREETAESQVAVVEGVEGE
jgi:uncharacterized protein (DUF1330 family)